MFQKPDAVDRHQTLADGQIPHADSRGYLCRGGEVTCVISVRSHQQQVLAAINSQREFLLAAWATLAGLHFVGRDSMLGRQGPCRRFQGLACNSQELPQPHVLRQTTSCRL
jgi:hypothetical protein